MAEYGIELIESLLKVQLAALEYEASRLVRILDDQGRRLGFGEGGAIEVVSARSVNYRDLVTSKSLGYTSSEN